MSQIVLDEAQTETVVRAGDKIQVLDRHGNVLGYIVPSPFTEDDLTEAHRRAASNSRRYTTQEVFERLRQLEQP